MLRISRRICLIGLLAAAAAGCAPRLEGDWSPLRTGLTWSYNEYDLTSGGQPVAATIRIRVLRPNRDYLDAGEAFWLRRASSDPNRKPQLEEWIHQQDEEGYALWVSAPTLHCPLMVPPPADGWLMTGDRDGPVCRYEGLRPVKVPAGSFECMTVYAQHPLTPGVPVRAYRYWFARDVGLVRYAGFEGRRAVYILELTSFSRTDLK